MLLERDRLLDILSEHVQAASEGRGSLLLVAGEAGAGKTSLIRGFVEGLDDSVLVIVGACDPLSTPRPLGPLRDFAADPRSGLDDLSVDEEDAVVSFQAVLARLQHTTRPILLVIEDIHWADQGTLDMIRFLGRRIANSKAVVACTFRDDEIAPDHPLRPVLGQLIPLTSTTRVEVPPLTEKAVEQLARDTNVDPTRLHVLTGGNAFFVTEVLAHGGDLPATVSDAVLARLAQLEPGSRDVAHAVSIAPRALEMDRALLLLGSGAQHIDRAVSSGLILGDGHQLRFRHELARSAVEASVPPAQRHELHSRMLALLLEEDPADEARLAHHAIRAHSPELIVDYAPPAAAAAVRRGARKEAVDLYRAALDHAVLMEDSMVADIRRQLAEQLRILDRPRESLAELDQAIAYYREVGDIEALAGSLALKQSELWSLSRIEEGWEASREAIDLLRPRGPSGALARLLYRKAHHHMLARHAGPAFESAAEALQLALESGDSEAEWEAKMIIGCTHVVVGEAGIGLAMLEESRAEAENLGNTRFSTVALGMLGSGGGESRRYDTAIEYLEEAISVGLATDEDSSVAYARSWLARIAFEQGRWDDAIAAAEAVERTSIRKEGVAILTAMGAVGRVRVRRGDPGGRETLESVIEMGRANELQHVWSPIAGLAEFHWLRDDPTAAIDTLSTAYRRALDTDSSWARGEIGFWMWKAGEITTPPEGVTTPFHLQISGDWSGAAASWREIGCPYEVAMALADGDTSARLEALEIFDSLGARPMGDRVRAQLREMGVDSIPRGPTRSTRHNPAGLTNRQMEVLQLMALGNSNSEIAEQLFVTKRTVEHHVSAIFAKLGVESRAKAIAVAAQHLG